MVNDNVKEQKRSFPEVVDEFIRPEEPMTPAEREKQLKLECHVLNVATRVLSGKLSHRLERLMRGERVELSLSLTDILHDELRRGMQSVINKTARKYRLQGEGLERVYEALENAVKAIMV